MLRSASPASTPNRPALVRVDRTPASATTCRTTRSSPGSCWPPAASRARATTITSRKRRPITATRTRPTSPRARPCPTSGASSTCEQPDDKALGFSLHLPRRPARVRPVPQAPVRPVDAGRLQAVHRLLHAVRLRHRARRPEATAAAMREGARHRQEEGGDLQKRAAARSSRRGSRSPGRRCSSRNGRPPRAPVTGQDGRRRTAVARVVTPKLLGGDRGRSRRRRRPPPAR